LRRTRPDATSVLGDLRLGVELARFDELLDQAEIDDGEFLAVGLVEAALRQTLVERHLAALIGIDRHARTGFLTLDAAAGGLAHARTRATADTLGFFRRAGIVAQFIQFHVASSPSVWGPEHLPEAMREGHGIS
jgi:hypothetical protein